MLTNTFDAHQLRRIAVEAACDPDTVRKFLKGESLRSVSRVRIEAALERLGIPGPQNSAVAGHRA